MASLFGIGDKLDQARNPTPTNLPEGAPTYRQVAPKGGTAYYYDRQAQKYIDADTGAVIAEGPWTPDINVKLADSGYTFDQKLAPEAIAKDFEANAGGDGMTIWEGFGEAADNTWETIRDEAGKAVDTVTGRRSADGSGGGPSVGNPETFAGDLNTARTARDSLFSDYKNYQPGSVPMMDAATVERTTLNPAAQSQGATVGPMSQASVTTADTARVSDVERAGYEAAQAVLASGGSVEAAQAAFAQAKGARIAANERAGAAIIDLRMQNQTRESQLGNIRMLEDFASGRTMSPEELALKRATDQNIAQQRGLAVAAGRGGNTVLAQRIAAQNIAKQNQLAAGQSAEAALRTRMASAQALSQAVAAARGQDVSLATDQAQMITDVNKLNATETNATNRTQAQMAQQNEQFNTGNYIDVSKFNAGQTNDVNKFNVGIATDVSKYNAGLETDVSKYNAGNVIDVSKFNASQGNDISKFNVSETNDANQFNAGQENETSRFNTGQTNTGIIKQSELTQDNNQFNAGETNKTNIAQGNITSSESIKNADLEQGAAANNQDATITTRTQDIQEKSNILDAATTTSGQTIQGGAEAMKADAIRDGADKAFAGSLIQTGVGVGMHLIDSFGGKSSGSTSGGSTSGYKLPADDDDVFTTSDERAKTKVKDGKGDLMDLFNAIERPKSYEYKRPGRDGSGQRLGVMAQDVEKGAPEKVIETDDGKKLHVDVSTMLAMFGDLNRRVRMLEK